MDAMDIDLPSSLIPSFAHGLHILVVEHNTTSLMYLASMLEQYSYKVTTTELASVALSMIREGKDRFNLVMANVNMPDFDILSFLRVLVMKNIPIILMSSKRNLRVAWKALAEGASHYLEKPICPDDLKYVWQHVYRKKKNPMKGNQKADHVIKVNCGRKEFRSIKFKEQIYVSKNVATGNDLQGIDHQRKINVPKGTNKQIALEGCLNQLTSDDPKWKNKQTVVEGFLNDPKGKNKDIVVERCLNDYLKEKDKQKVVEWCLNEENGEESQNTCIKQMITKENQKQGGFIIKRSNEEKEGNGNEKRMKINSEQIISISEKTNEEGGKGIKGWKDWKDWKDNNIFSRDRRRRVVWNSELHLKFTAAVSALGDRNARPKSILQMMNAPNLTQRQVASHLQKYKAQVKRLCETATSSFQSTKPTDIFSKTGSSQTLEKHSSVAAYGSSSIAVGGLASLSGNSTQYPQSYHSNIHNAVQRATFGEYKKMNQINETGTFSHINKHGNGIEKQPLELETGNVHMSKWNLPSMTQEVASRNVSVETFQFPNVPNYVHKGLKFSPVLAAPSGSHNWNKVSMTSTGTIGGLNIVPGSGNVPNADKVPSEFTYGNQEVDAIESSTPNVPNDVHKGLNFSPVLAAPSGSHNWNKVPMTSTGTIGGLNIVPGSGNAPNADKVPSEFTYGNQQVDATESSTPLICSLNQSQPLSKYDDFLKELEKETELKNTGCELNQGDIDQYCDFLKELEKETELKNAGCELNQCDVDQYCDFLKELEKETELKNAGCELNQGDVDQYCDFLKELEKETEFKNASCELNQGDVDQYCDFFKEIEKEREFKNADCELKQGDVDQYCDWLTDGLFGDSLNPEYFDGAEHWSYI